MVTFHGKLLNNQMVNEKSPQKHGGDVKLLMQMIISEQPKR